MKRPPCGEVCQNTQVFKGFADGVTLNDEAARQQYGAGCKSGAIACSGAIENPAFGSFCGAKLIPSVVNEHPEATWVCPAEKVEDIPGYTVFANQKVANLSLNRVLFLLL